VGLWFRILINPDFKHITSSSPHVWCGVWGCTHVQACTGLNLEKATDLCGKFQWMVTWSLEHRHQQLIVMEGATNRKENPL